MEEKRERELPITTFGELVKNLFQLGPSLEGLDKASECSKIQSAFPLLVSDVEPSPQLVTGRIEVQSVAHLLDVIKV